MTMMMGAAHGYCLLWNGPLVAAHVLSDALIAFAYFMIPVVLFSIRQLFNWDKAKHILTLFGIFIVSCGMTHVMDIIVLWYPIYWVQAAVKMITAIASMLTFYEMLRMLKFSEADFAELLPTISRKDKKTLFKRIAARFGR